MENVTKEVLDQFKQDLIKELTHISVTRFRPKRLLKNTDLMEYLGCSYSTIENLRNERVIPYKKVMGTYFYSYDKISKIFGE
jgi:hypothetical protein